MKKTVLLLLVLATTGCTNQKTALRTLELKGYRVMGFNGYSLTGCDFEWQYEHTKFVAFDKKGEMLSGVVCSGWGNRPIIKLN
jgi:hypothetical protein